ncbi:MAG: hypothetical protein ACW99G_11455 [Candidatus Thorarchaeota archaeon]
MYIQRSQMKKTLFDIIDGWTLVLDRGIIEITLSEMSSSFYKKKVVFLLLEELWDILEQFNDPGEFMTDERAMELIEKILRDGRIERVAKFVEVEQSGPPQHDSEVVNVDEIIAQFPSWFKKYDGTTGTESSSKLHDE